MSDLVQKDPPAGVSLGELASVLRRAGLSARVLGDAATRVTDARQDSRGVQRGDLFVARVGAASDGRGFVPQALESGASAVMVERGFGLGGGDQEAPVLEVERMQEALGVVAEAVHGAPTQEMTGIALTGTNGKTTTAVLVQGMLTHLGMRTARLGTLGYLFEQDEVSGSLTTPAADELSRLLARAKSRGATHFVMEASSHALAQRRLDALHLSVGAFSNLTQDHLDYHGTLEAYFEAKSRLFLELRPSSAVINVDDSFGRRLAEEIEPVYGRALLRVGRAGDADLRLLGSRLSPSGIQAVLSLRGAAPVEVSSSLWGEHNMENLLLAAGIGLCVSPETHLTQLFSSLEKSGSVPGRLERCDDKALGDDICVLVDYAHTPDALGRALRAVKPMAEPGTRLICVFGCGGDRDREKRPLMGDIAGRFADHSVLTNDNPRSENPSDIAREVAVGLIRVDASYEVELDRAAAIERAILLARPGDTVLIAGKGHEDYQIVGGQVLDFDDRTAARRSLVHRRNRP